MGPMTAAGLFLDTLRERGADDVARLRCTLHGSLSFTGKGHGTDRAVIIGLMGCTPDTIDPDMMAEIEAEVRARGTVTPPALREFAFAPDADLVFDFEENLPGHANGMALAALDADGAVLTQRIYYSIGGGFVVEASELQATISDEDVGAEKRERAFPIRLATPMR